MHDRPVAGDKRRRIERRRFVTARREVDDSIDAAWWALVDELGARPDTVDEHARPKPSSSIQTVSIGGSSTAP